MAKSYDFEARIDQLATLKIKINNIKNEIAEKYKSRIDALEEEASALEEQIKRDMMTVNTTKIGGERGSYSLSPSDQFFVEDVKKFWGYLKRTGSMQLLQNRLASAAAIEEEIKGRKGRKIPGLNKRSITKGTFTFINPKK